VEYPCHQCGAAVEQGTAFCSQCRAPQIRVAVPETVTPSGITSDPAVSSPLPAYFGAPLTTRIEWSQALPATALAGLITAVLMMTPLAYFGFGMLIGGSLSVVFYRRRIPVANVTPGMGARLGMVSGILGGGIFAALLSIGTMLFHAWDNIRAKLIEVVEQAAARNPDPQAQQALEFFKSPEGIVLLLTTALIGTLLAFVIFSGLGGALGAALLRRKEHP
jgi:hypothetical protein